MDAFGLERLQVRRMLCHCHFSLVSCGYSSVTPSRHGGRMPAIHGFADRSK
jgi:hypothetical protein